jgi:hypothetical protein
MLDNLVFYFPYFALALVGLIAVLKITIFVRHKTRKDNWGNLLYYPFYNIELSSNSSKKGIKRFQNTLTIIISILLMLCLVFKLLIKQ